MTLNSKNTSIKQVFESIEKESPFMFVFSPDEIDQTYIIKRNYNSLTLEAILVDIFSEKLKSNEHLKIRQVGKYIILKKEKTKELEKEQELSCNIIGKIIDQKTKEPLPGATFLLKESNIGASTNLDGEFEIEQVNPGAVQVYASYIGFEKMDTILNLIPGENRFLIELNAGLKLQPVTVNGNTSGQVKAINQQLTSDGIRNVVSSELMGRFPDMNVAEALQRVSGINITRDRGEGSTIQLRGTPSNYTITTIHGEPISISQADGKRAEQLDILPVNQLSSMEVIKSLTPAMNGNAIGGIINLTPTQARFSSPLIKIDLGAGFVDITKRIPKLFSGSYSQRFFPDSRYKNGKLGIVMGGSYYSTPNSRDGIEIHRWDYRPLDDAPDSDNSWLIGADDLKYVHLVAQRERIGLFSTLDYKYGNNSSVFMNIMYSQRNDNDNRYRTRYRFNRGTFISPDTILNGRIRRDLNIRNVKKELVTWILGGKSQFRKMGINYQLFYSKSNHHENSNISVFERRNTHLVINNLYTNHPDVVAMDPLIDIHDPGLINDYKFYYDNNVKTSSSRISGKIDLNRIVFFNDTRVELLAGVKYADFKNARNADNNDYDINIENEDNLFASLMAENQDTYFLNGKNRLGPRLDEAKSQEFNRQNISLFSRRDNQSQYDSESQFYTVNERVWATYLMGKIRFNQYLLLGGLRAEATRTKTQAYIIKYDEEPLPRKEKDNYVIFLPNFQVKWNKQEREVLRLAYTTGYGRPDFIEFIPTVSGESDQNIINLGNPDLQPSYSHNFDFIYEKFFDHPGLWSAGLFYKSIHNFHYRTMYPYDESLVSDELNSLFDENWIMIQSRNGKRASVWGIETNYQSNFYFLSGIWENFGAYFNYTFTHSDAIISDQRTMQLPGQAPHTANFALTFQDPKLSCRASLNYNGEFIYQAGVDALSDIYQAERWQLDVNGTYKINKHLSLFAEFINITNTNQVLFWSSKSRIYQLDSYGWWCRLGVSIRL